MARWTFYEWCAAITLACKDFPATPAGGFVSFFIQKKKDIKI
jgi:hypothetical protein